MACAAKGLDSGGPPSLLCRLYFEAWLRTSISLFGAYARLCFLSLCQTHTRTHTSSSLLVSGRPLVSLALVPFLSLGVQSSSMASTRVILFFILRSTWMGKSCGTTSWECGSILPILFFLHHPLKGPCLVLVIE